MNFPNLVHIKKYLFLLFVKCQVIFQHCAKVGASATNRIELRFWNPEWIPLLFFSVVTLLPILFWLDSQTGQQINGRTANLKTSGFHYCTHVKNFEGYVGLRQQRARRRSVRRKTALIPRLIIAQLIVYILLSIGCETWPRFVPPFIQMEYIMISFLIWTLNKLGSGTCFFICNYVKCINLQMYPTFTSVLYS